MEKLGIEHIDEGKRHGRLFNTFTLWFGANLTVADFALGSLFFGLPFSSIAVAVVIGNLVGGLLLGLMAAMGPTFGYPQMMISRAILGKKGNAPFALATWISTVGWFTVNIILGGYALQIAFHLPFYMAAGLMVLADTALAIYGHDIIHMFERIMSVTLGVMFLVVTLIAYTSMGATLGTYDSTVSFSAYFWALVVAAIFSYLMSWSPYASDYTRYLPTNSSKLRLVAYTVAGGAIASAWTEIAGFFVYVAAKNNSLNTIAALASISGGYSIAALLTVVLGALAADALNLYTNSLSALVLYGKVGRVQTVLVAGAVGFLLSLLGSTNFGAFYQNFLLTLDYWITPWIGVMLAAFYARKMRSGVESAGGFQKAGLASYVIGLVVSVPFMNLSSYGVNYTGAAASLIGGADVSYFVAFIAAFAAYVALSRKKATA
jgi:NCS1 family nucleobase:cation symporter-1